MQIKHLQQITIMVAGLIIPLSLTLFACTHKKNQNESKASHYFKHFAERKQASPLVQAIKLIDGRVLIYDTRPAEIFDPVTKKSELIPGIDQCTKEHWDRLWATLLPNGKILFTGRILSKRATSAAIFDPDSKTFKEVDFQLSLLKDHYATVNLPHRKVLFVGGIGMQKDYKTLHYPDLLDSAPITSDINMVDSETLKVTPMGKLRERRTNHAAYLLNDHQLIILGGRWPNLPIGSNNLGMVDRSSVEIFDLNTKKSKIVGHLKVTDGPVDTYTVNLGDGRIMFAGKYDPGKKQQPIEIYKVATNTSDVFYIKRLDLYNNGLWLPTLLPNGHILSVASYVRDIDPNKLTSRVLEYNEEPVPKHVLWTRNGKLLLFYGEYKGESYKKALPYDIKPKVSKSISIFDYEKYLKESR